MTNAVPNDRFVAWLERAREPMSRYQEQLPSPANEYTVLAIYSHGVETEQLGNVQVELRGFDADAVPLEVELAPGAVVQLADIRIELTNQETGDA